MVRERRSQPQRTPTFLASLCRYYLACLSQESGLGISIPAADPSAYVELKELPFVHPEQPWGTDRAARKLAQKVRRERGQLTLYLGFAVRLRSVILKDGDELRAEPVLLYPIEEAPDEPGELRPAGALPLFNLDVLKTLPAVDSGNVIDEAIQLSEELGLANSEEDLPPWDEMILRLQRCRPEWGWKEDLNPYALSAGAPLAKLNAPGIYNRAVLFAGTRSPFTYGLEMELRKLAQLDEAAVRDTALGAWLRSVDGRASRAPPEDRPILEVLPLNTEQRQAVVQGLERAAYGGHRTAGHGQVASGYLAAGEHGVAEQQRAVFQQEQPCGGRGGVARQRSGAVSAAAAARQGGASRADCAASDGGAGGIGERGRCGHDTRG